MRGCALFLFVFVPASLVAVFDHHGNWWLGGLVVATVAGCRLWGGRR
jgi:hypothetical protein